MPSVFITHPEVLIDPGVSIDQWDWVSRLPSIPPSESWTGARPASFHGGVGALLRASLTGSPISRSLDQPVLGSYFTFDPLNWTALSGWNRFPPR